MANTLGVLGKQLYFNDEIEELRNNPVSAGYKVSKI
jgi:hypothetical protein